MPDRDCVHLCPAGEIDLETAGAVEAAACDLLDRGFDSVVIDLRDVTFLDCSGIRALLGADRHGRDLNRRVSIVLPNPPTRRILEITGVIDRLQVEPPPPSTRERLELPLARESGGYVGITGRR